MKKLFTLGLLLSPWFALAQSNGAFSFRYDQRPTVSVNNRALLNPWAGGLNATQYGTLRLNTDNRDDLVVFDRTTGKISTFVAVDNGSGIAWQYAPDYEAAFPTIYGWMLLVDYDNDGLEDLFTYGAGSGVRVMRNVSQNGQVAFRLVADPLMTQGYSGVQPVYVASTDFPAILDYDDDGDVDILTFDPTGDQVAYQQNISVERTGKRDGLEFKRTSGLCWGYFKKNFCNDFAFGLDCGGSIEAIGPGLVEPKPGASPNGRPLHSGNTLTVVDTDGDGNKDLLFGFVTCSNLARLRGAGPNGSNARFVGFDSLFPAAKPVVFPAFPAVFWEDVDGDGQKDLLASPNVDYNDGRVYDFRASGWLYKNAGTNRKPDFRYVQADFLQSDMIDLGENATPTLADLDNDGDVDLLVGFSGVRSGLDYKAGLWHFENRGTTQNPAFVLVTTDYLDIRQTITLSNVIPQLVDLDGNGSIDLLLTGTGPRNLEMRALLNAAPKGVAVRFELNQATTWPVPGTMEIGDRPHVTDVDRDGFLDLLVGKNNGTISYFRNVGSATNPTFQLQNQAFGGLTADLLQNRARSIVVADLNGDRKTELISASDNGQVRVYQFPDRPDQPLTLLDSLPVLGLPGAGLTAAVADLDGDQLPDLMLGSRAGGLRYLRNTSQKVVITGTVEEPTSPWVFPNPTDRYLTVRPPYNGRIDLLSLAGQPVLPARAVRAGDETIIDLGQLPDGTYLLRLMAENQNAGTRPALVQKVVVWR